jgi:hypothetical protein
MRLTLVVAFVLYSAVGHAGEVVRTRSLKGGRTLTVKNTTSDSAKFRHKERSITAPGGLYLRFDTKSFDANGKVTESSRSDWSANRTRRTTSQHSWGVMHETQWQIGDREFLAENTTAPDGKKTWERSTLTKSGLWRYNGSADQKGAPARVRFPGNMLIDAGIEKMIAYAGKQKQPVQMEMSRGAFVISPGDTIGAARERFDKLR